MAGLNQVFDNNAGIGAKIVHVFHQLQRILGFAFHNAVKQGQDLQTIRQAKHGPDPFGASAAAAMGNGLIQKR